ncbi:hypothetical protein BGZ89_002644, partial [Linnemannia elongata]
MAGLRCTIDPILKAISSLDGPTSLTVSNQKDIHPELPIKFVNSVEGSVRVRRVWTVEDVCIGVRYLWRPNFRFPCAAAVILDDVAGPSSNYKKVLNQRGAIDSSSAPTRMN